MRDEEQVAERIEAAAARVPTEQRGRANDLWYATAAVLRVLADGKSGLITRGNFSITIPRAGIASESTSDASPVDLSEEESSQREKARTQFGTIAREVERNNARARAVGVVADDLSELLFFDPRTVINGDDSGTDFGGEQRLLIEFMKVGKLEELVAFVRSLEVQRDQAQVDLRKDFNFWASEELAEFLSTWLLDTSQDLVPNLQVAKGDPWGTETLRHRFIELLPQTASAGAAFRAWTKRFVAIRDHFAAERAIVPALERSNAALDELEQNADLVKSTAGKVGDESLATHFATLSDTEMDRARSWSIIAALGVLVTIVIGASVVGGWFTDDTTGWAEQLVHLALTLPIAAGTAYASTVASRHRQQAWWSATTAAQLHTFDAFSTPLPEADRAQLRAGFGARMFAEPAFNTHAQKPDSAAVTSAVSDLAAALSDLVKRGGDDKA